MRFEDVFGLDIATFNAEVRGKRFHLGKCRSGAPRLTWNTINELLDTSEAFSSKAFVVREDERLDRRVFTKPGRGADSIVPAALRAALRDGYSLLLNEVHGYHRPVRIFADELTAILGEKTSVNVYASWSSDKCFRTHWDSHDVLIFQTDGEKEWTVFKPTRVHAMTPDVAFER